LIGGFYRFLGKIWVLFLRFFSSLRDYGWTKLPCPFRICVIYYREA
jgi:hypothetical protein